MAPFGAGPEPGILDSCPLDGFLPMSAYDKPYDNPTTDGTDHFGEKRGGRDVENQGAETLPTSGATRTLVAASNLVPNMTTSFSLRQVLRLAYDTLRPAAF